MNETLITIFGSGKAKPGDAVYELAYSIGTILAQAGFGIANGGYAGVMEASAAGAAKAGGQVTGITCRAFNSGMANEYITKEIVTETLDQRIDTLIKAGDAFVVLPGGTGTLLELAKVWELKNKGFLNSDKPVILVGDFWRPLIELVASDDQAGRDLVTIAADAEQVRDILLRSIG